MPLPDGPATVSVDVAFAMAKQVETSASRPKKDSASSMSNGSKPRYGQVLAGDELAETTRARSWRRMLLKGYQAGAGVQSEPMHQECLDLLNRAQRLTLPSCLVLRMGKECPAPLAHRCCVHHALSLGHHLAMATELEGGLDTELLGIEPSPSSRSVSRAAGCQPSTSA